MNLKDKLLGVSSAIVTLTLCAGCQASPRRAAAPATTPLPGAAAAAPTATQVSAPSPSPSPSAAPSAAPSPGASTGLEGFETEVTQSLVAGDLERMRGLMSDPFTFAYWQSEGAITTRDEALVLLKDALALRGKLAFEPYDLIRKLHWREHAEDGSKLVRALRVTGWQSSAPQAEALVLIYQRPSGGHVWTALVISTIGLP